MRAPWLIALVAMMLLVAAAAWLWPSSGPAPGLRPQQFQEAEASLPAPKPPVARGTSNAPVEAPVVRAGEVHEPENAPASTGGDTAELTGTVRDEQGRPLAGVRVYAIWSRAENPNDRLPNWVKDLVRVALRLGKKENALRSVWYRSAVSDANGNYRVGLLPNRPLHLFAAHRDYWVGVVDQWIPEPGAVADWRAQRTYPVEITLDYPDDTPLPHTTCWCISPWSMISGGISPDGRLLRLQLAAGEYQPGIHNDPWRLESDLTSITVTASSKPQRFQAVLRRKPFPRVRVTYAGALPAGTPKLQWASVAWAKDRDLSPEVAVVQGSELAYSAESGLHFRESDRDQAGPWYCGLVFGKRCLAWVRFDAEQTAVELELHVPAPDPPQCCRLLVNRDVLGDLAAAWRSVSAEPWQFTSAVVWRESARSWLVQPQQELPREVNQLALFAPNLGRLGLPHDGSMGGELHAEFRRPATLLVEAPEALPHLVYRCVPYLVEPGNRSVALDYAPGGWGLATQDSDVTLWLRPGTYRITWDPGGEHPHHPTVTFTIAKDEHLILDSKGLRRESVE